MAQSQRSHTTAAPNSTISELTPAAAILVKETLRWVVLGVGVLIAFAAISILIPLFVASNPLGVIVVAGILAALLLFTPPRDQEPIPFFVLSP